MATKSGKKFSQVRRAEIEKAKVDAEAKRIEDVRKAEERVRVEADRKARLSKIQNEWFALTA